MYKDKEKEREASRERVRRYRESQKGVTSQGVTSQGVTLKKRPNRMGADGFPEMVENEYNPDEKMPDGSKRYIPCHDGQVFDVMSRMTGNWQTRILSGTIFRVQV